MELRTLDEATAEAALRRARRQAVLRRSRRFITGGPLVAMVVEGPEAWKVVRTLMGTTNPREAAPGTIRGDLAIELTENLVHGSDGPDSAEPARSRSSSPAASCPARAAVGRRHLAAALWIDDGVALPSLACRSQHSDGRPSRVSEPWYALAGRSRHGDRSRHGEHTRLRARARRRADEPSVVAVNARDGRPARGRDARRSG